MNKICLGCGRELSIDDYYKHPQMSDGHLNYCKECVRARVAKHREQHISQIREYDRQRGKLPHRKAKAKAISKRRQREVIGYMRGHNAVTRAVNSGELTRANVCQVCGKPCKTEGHHYDYGKSKQVIWLCTTCHRQLHTGKTKRADMVRQIAGLMTELPLC